ncbi:hypothetical protein DC030_15170, partial [Enterococcus faecalis]
TGGVAVEKLRQCQAVQVELQARRCANECLELDGATAVGVHHLGIGAIAKVRHVAQFVGAKRPGVGLAEDGVAVAAGGAGGDGDGVIAVGAQVAIFRAEGERRFAPGEA